MKGKNEISLSLPACAVTERALLIDDRATDKQFAELGGLLAKIEGANSFWLGDYGLALRTRKLQELQKLNPGVAPEGLHTKGTRYLTERAEALGIDPQSWVIYISVAQFYKVPIRIGMSFGHHYVAMGGAGGVNGDPKKAVSLLLQAQENGWSVSRLRHHVRTADATGFKPTAEPEDNPLKPLDDADQWAIKHQDYAPEPDYAIACLTRFAALFRVMDKIREAAAKAPQP